MFLLQEKGSGEIVREEWLETLSDFNTLMASRLSLEIKGIVKELSKLQKQHEELWKLSEKLVEANERQPISRRNIADAADAVRFFMNASQHPEGEVKS